VPVPDPDRGTRRRGVTSGERMRRAEVRTATVPSLFVLFLAVSASWRFILRLFERMGALVDWRTVALAVGRANTMSQGEDSHHG